MKLVSKLPNVGTTIFSTMSQLANEHQAINLAQGFPDFDTDVKLKSLIGFYSLENYNQYAPMPGIEKLRREIAKKLTKSHQKSINHQTEITITAGATQAIFTVIATLIKTDDEVIIFEPAYDCYQPSIELFGGKVIPIQLHFPDYKIDWTEVEQKVNEKTKLIILNQPNNPSTKLLKKKDLDELAKIIKQKDIYVLSDEVYENMVYDEQEFLPIFSHEDLQKRTFTVASFGKLFHITGWKIGYCYACEELMSEFRKVHQYNVFSVNTPAQMALAEFMEDENNYIELNDFYQKKRDYFIQGLATTKFELTTCEATYFLTCSYKNYSNEDDFAFAQNLTILNKVASIPVSAFYHNQLDERVIRFCFAKKEETLDAALEKLNRL